MIYSKEQFKLLNDNEVRNLVLWGYWLGLKSSDLKFTDKIKLIAGEFFISEKRVQNIISEKKKGLRS
jgi:hypothetical protein|tara:strand:- start:4851 stop:5051 length:201 start_codon:yes stop_codon:yes gene_type:complete